MLIAWSSIFRFGVILEFYFFARIFELVSLILNNEGKPESVKTNVPILHSDKTLETVLKKNCKYLWHPGYILQVFYNLLLLFGYNF